VHRRLKRPVALGAAGLLAVAGGGAAYAAATASSPRDAILKDAAQRLNVSPEKLSAALKGAFEDQLDQAVKDGKLTRQQADRIKQRIERGGGLPPFGPRFGMRGGPFGGPHDGPRGELKAVADYLGLTPAKLFEQLRAGKTLADVAKAQGKPLAGLEQAIVAAAKARLEKAVSSGRITAQQRDMLLERLQQHVGDLVQGRLPRFGGPGMRDRGFGFGFGPPPGGWPDGPDGGGPPPGARGGP
jgi:hypothetical protein